MNYKLISIISLLALILGGIVGYFAPQFMISISSVGNILLNGLQLLVFPIIIVFVIHGFSLMRDYGKINRSVGKSFLYFTMEIFSMVVYPFYYFLVVGIFPLWIFKNFMKSAFTLYKGFFFCI